MARFNRACSASGNSARYGSTSVLLYCRFRVNLRNAFRNQRRTDLFKKPRKLFQACRDTGQARFQRPELSCHQAVDSVADQTSVCQGIPGPFLQFFEPPELGLKAVL